VMTSFPSYSVTAPFPSPTRLNGPISAHSLFACGATVRFDHRSHWPVLDIEGDQGFSVEAGPVSSRARSRSRNFCSFPVEVFGKGPKMTVFGALKCAKRSRQK